MRTSNKGARVARNKLVVRVGLNDADYPVLRREGDKKHTCPKYAMWCRMLARCYDPKTHNKQPTYIGCSVCGEWLTFSKFLSWLDTQDYEGKQLDKDLLIPGNKIYCPDACCFITHRLNTFLKDNRNTRGSFPLWVTFKKRNRLFEIRVCDPFGHRSNYQGCTKCPIESHKKGQAVKHKYALELAELESDVRIKKALSERYSPDKNWLDF